MFQEVYVISTSIRTDEEIQLDPSIYIQELTHKRIRVITEINSSDTSCMEK
jgi:hypothetical protein